MRLRPYQRRALAEAEGKKRVLFVAPTGAGKGTMAVHLLKQAAKQRQRALFVVHLRDIAEDIAGRAQAAGVPVGMMLPGHKRDPRAPVQVASVQSLAKQNPGPFDLVIADEAHHYRASEWQSVLDGQRAARLVGFTATPERSDGKGLGDVFDDLIDVVSYSELLASGLIVPCRLFVPPQRLDGDTAMDPDAAYLKYARGTSALVFARSLAAAADVRDRLMAAGVRAEVVTDKTPHRERTATVQALRTGRVKVVVNYGTLVEGVDVPRVSTIVLDQPCTHRSTYIQRVGRAVRAFEGKRSAIVLDLVGSGFRHGVPLQDWTYELHGDEPIKLANGAVAIRQWHRRQPSVRGAELLEADAAWLAANGGPRIVDWSRVGLGTRTDRDIAREIGVSESTVGHERARRGIPVFGGRPKIDWDSVGLGTTTDSVLAKEIGVSVSAVCYQRIKRGIRAFDERTLWDRVALGADVDSKLAAKLGVGVSAVAAARRRRGIKAIGTRSRGIKWDLVDLGNRPDAAIAAELGVTIASVRKQRLNRGIALCPAHSINWDLVDLGNRPDAAIAAELGVTAPSVAQQRAKRGIPAHQQPSHWDAAGLGRKPDAVIAAQLGVSRAAVKAARLRRSIPPFTKTPKDGSRDLHPQG